MRVLLFTIFLFLADILHAQGSLSGTVTDNKNKPIPGASVTIKDSYDGGTTDNNGKFSFATTEKGEHILVITAVGFVGTEQKINLNGTALQFAISLKEEISELKAVVITAGSFEASDKKRATVLSSLDVVTTASANADITGAIKTLPGAQQVGESEGLFVRGGTAAETKTFIDGTLVNNFFFSSVPNISQRGRFSPFIFKGTVFSAGGYSALYGQALSSALILESIDLPDRSSANLSISPLALGGGFQQLDPKKRYSWGVNYNYTFLDLVFNVIKQKPEYFRMPRYHNGDANFRIKTGNNGMLKYYGYISQNALGIRNQSIDSLSYKEAFELSNVNTYHNLSWKGNLGSYWKLNLGASYASNKDNIQGYMNDEENTKVLVDADGFRQKNFLIDNYGRYINSKIVLERRLRGLSAIRFGTEYNYSRDSVLYTPYNGFMFPSLLKEHLFSGFAEADIYLTNDLAAKIGGRAEHSSLLNLYNLAPRLSLAYKLGEGQASLAYGVFYQSPERRYLPSPVTLDFAKATHYIAQYQKVTNLQTLRGEMFYKKYQNLLKTSNSINQQAAGSTGTGYAQGFELFWRDKKSINNFDYWISYSYLDTKRNYLNYPASITPSFAAKHTANLVVKKFVTKLKTQFNANYAFATGRPYYNIRYDNNSGKYAIYDQGRTIDFNSLSFSVNYLPNVFKKNAKAFTVFVFSVTNVLGSKQIYGYNYSMNGMRKWAIEPPSRSFVFIGAFISFGVDRTQDVINNNL